MWERSYLGISNVQVKFSNKEVGQNIQMYQKEKQTMLRLALGRRELPEGLLIKTKSC